MTDWKAFKLKAEDVFKKEHASEMLNAHKDGVTGFPVKFPLGLSPVLVNLEAARKKTKAEDVKKYAGKAKEIIDKYQILIDGKKKELGGAYSHLNNGLAAVKKSLA